METGREILDGLAAPGQDLIFVDESGTSGNPLQNLASDFQIMSGVRIFSSHYPELRDSLQNRLPSYCVDAQEFHATEIVNPTTKSAWRSVSLEVRLDAFRFLADALVNQASEVFFCFVSGPQYNELLDPSVNLSQKKGLRKVFFESLLERLRAQPDPKPLAIVADAESDLGDAIMIQAVKDLPTLYQGGLIHSKSNDEPGLQVADLAAYLLNRIYHSTLRIRRGAQNPFDEVVLDTYLALRPRLVDLLGG